MKVAILTQFSRGDVQPFAALARGLTAAGHRVVVGAPGSSAELVEPHADRVVRLDDVAARLMSEIGMRRALDVSYHGPRGKVLGMRHMRRHRALVAATRDDLVRAVDDDVDVVVHHGLLPGHQIAERLGVPAVPVFIDPFWVPTNAFADPEFPFRLPTGLNRLSFLPSSLRRRVLRTGIDAWRRDSLGLPPRRGHHDPLRGPDGTPATVLQAFSRHAIRAPLDYPEWVHTTGYWFLPANDGWAPPARLVDFIAAGPPPVYLGFGSYVGTDPERTGRLIADAVRIAKVRAVLVAGWGGLGSSTLDGDVLVVDHAPFDWLFPHMAAVVHHGGGGACGAALAAGRPQVVCPFAVSGQRFWSRHMHANGVAPPPLPQYRLTAGALAAAIRRAVADPALARRADVLGRRVRAEDGVTDAVKLLESLV